MSIVFIFRNTVTAARSAVPTVERTVASSDMLMKKVLSGFQTLSANVIMKTHAGIIIRHGNIFTTILIHCRLGVKACRNHPVRQLKFLLMSHRLSYTLKWLRGALQITVGILYTATCAESSVKRRQPDFSAFIKSVLPTNGAVLRSIGRQTYPARQGQGK